MINPLKDPRIRFLILLFLAAFFLRVWRLDLMEYKHDEAAAWLLNSTPDDNDLQNADLPLFTVYLLNQRQARSSKTRRLDKRPEQTPPDRAFFHELAEHQRKEESGLKILVFILLTVD